LMEPACQHRYSKPTDQLAAGDEMAQLTIPLEG